MACLSRPYHLKTFKGCLPQILLGPFLNTLTHVIIVKVKGLMWQEVGKDIELG